MPEPSSASEKAPVSVLLVSAAGFMGGAERSLYELLCALPEDRVKAHACVPQGSPLAWLCALAEVPVHPAPLRRFRRTAHPFLLAGQVRALYRTAQTIRALVKELKLDVLHANTDSSAMVCWEVSRETGIPFIWHARDLRPLGPLIKLLAHSTARAVAISKAVEDHLVAQGVAREKITRVVNGIDIKRLHGPEDRPAVRARMRQLLGLGEDVPILMNVGGWVPWKRHELFLEAVALVRKERPNAIGVLVGSDLFEENDAYAGLLERRLAELDLGPEALLVLQQRDDIPDLLAAADMLVSPGDMEPFGRVLAEAGAAGLPVASTDSGGKGEIVEDGVTGFLSAPGDAAGLAASCIKLIDDPAFARDVGLRAREHCIARFDIHRVAREIVAVYESVRAK